MPGRVNTKFVLILVTVIVTLTMVLGGVYYFKIRRNPEQSIRKGDVFLREGQYDLALDSYRRAIGQAPDNLEYLDKFLNLLKEAPVEFRTDADRYLSFMISAARKKVDTALNDEQVQHEYYQLLVDLAEQLDYPTMYERLYSDTDARLSAQPELPLPRKYRGIAQVHRLIDRGDAFDIPRKDQLQAQEDLMDALDHDPYDNQVLHELARWNLFDARYLRQTAAPVEQVQQRRTEALELSRRMLETDPDNIELILDHAGILNRAAQDINKDPQPDTDKADALQDEAMQLAAKAEQRLLEDPQPRDSVLTTVQLLLADEQPATLPDSDIQTTRGVQRALALLDAARQQHPDTVDYLVRTGTLLMHTRQLEPALELLEKARQPGKSFPAVETLRLQNQRLTATLRVCDLLIARMAENKENEDPSQNDQLAQRVMGLVGEIESTYGRLPALDLIEGKLRMVQGEVARSQQLLDRAASATGESNIEAMRLAANVSTERGDWGDAARRLELLLQRDPRNVTMRLQLTEIYLKGGQPDDAQRHLEPLLEHMPDNPIVQMLHASMLALNDQFDEAIAICESLDPTEHPQVDPMLIRMYLVTDRKDDARRLLAKMFDEDPGNLQLLQPLLQLAEDPQQKQAYLDQARQAGANPQMIEVIQRRLSDNPMSQDELAAVIDQIQADPFQRAVLQARRLMAAGQPDDADKMLQEAATLQPDNPALIDLRFVLAMTRKDWDQARMLADRAAANNADLAAGEFFYGRLAGAQGDLEAAVAHYEQGLAARPIYAMGWRLLGDTNANLRRMEPAVDAYTRSLQQQPNNATTLNHLSRVEQLLGRFESALNHAREAYKYQPADAEIRERYLQLEGSHGDAEEAIRLRREMVESRPYDTDSQRRLAQLLGEQDQYEEAFSLVDRVIEREGLTGENALVKAVLMLRAERVEDGAELLRGYIDQRGENATSADYLLLSTYWRIAGRIDESIAAVEEAQLLDNTPELAYTRLLGDLLFEQQVNDRAVQIYRELTERFPDDVKVRMRLGETLIRQGEYAEAERVLDNLGQVEPELRATLYVLRSMLAAPQRPGDEADANEERDREARAEALRWVNLALQEDPNNAVAYVRRAALLFDQPQRSSAVINDLNRALEINSNLTNARAMLTRAYLRQDNRPEAIRELRQFLEQRPDDTGARVGLIKLYSAAGEMLSAQRLIDEAIELHPNEPSWVDMRAQMAIEAGNTADALRQLRRLVQLSPNPSTVSRYVDMLVSNEQTDRALSVLREHAMMVNRVPVLQAMRARLTAASGQPQQAELLFVNALNRSNSFGDVNGVVRQMLTSYPPDQVEQLIARSEVSQPLWLDLAHGTLLMQERRYEQAVTLLEPLQSTLPSDPTIQGAYWRTLATAYHMAQHPQDARDAYDKVLELTPDDVGTLNNLAYLQLENLNQPEAALKTARRAARAAPDNASVLDTLGWALYRTGQLDEARQTLEDSFNEDPLPANCLHLAQVYMDLNMNSRARDLLNRAVELAEQSHDTQVRDQAEELLAQIGR